MCTACSYTGNCHLFGRNLDLEYNYQEQVTVMPRNFPLRFRHMPATQKHPAMIGIATVSQGYPLYYDACNEAGVCMAGLNFPDYAGYAHTSDCCLAPFEVIPWVLANCRDAQQAVQCLTQISISAIPFSREFPLSPLHWCLCDRTHCYTIEPIDGRLEITENPTGILTNSPPFSYHMTNLCNYMGLSPNTPKNRFSRKIHLNAYSRGMGGLGLPGDYSSASRFVKAAFVAANSSKKDDSLDDIAQFFHILDSVSQPDGCIHVEDAYEKTIYSSCCDTLRGIYYYRTYTNSQLSAVALHNENCEGEKLITYPLLYRQSIFRQN